MRCEILLRFIWLAWVSSAEMEPVESAVNSLKYVLEAVPGESILIISDYEKKGVAEAYSKAALKLGLWTRLIQLEKPEGFRREVPGSLVEAVISGKPDMYLNLLRGPAEEVEFRIKLIKLETRRRVRLAHCPGVTMDMLTKGALALSQREYEEMKSLAQEFIAILQDVTQVRVTSPEGTDASFSVRDREFFTDVMLDWRTLKWINLPVGEVMVAPVENSMNGAIHAIAAGGVGLVEGGIRLTVRNGRVREVKYEDKEKGRVVEKVLETDRQASIAGEFALGLNRRARIVEEFLESEKAYGTIHIAFGNNMDFPGGRNSSKSHIDFLVDKPTVTVTFSDGSTAEIMSEGKPKPF